MLLISFVPKEQLPAKINNIKYQKVVFIEKDKLNRNTLDEKWRDFINNFSSIKIDDESILNKLNIQENLNIWFYNKFRLFHSCKEAFYEINDINEFLDTSEKITIVSEVLTQNIFKINNNISVVKSSKKIHKKKKYLSSILNYALIFIYRFLISKKNKKNVPLHILHGLIDSEIEMQSITQNKTVKLNSVWGYLAEKNHINFTFIEDIQFPNLNSSFKLKKRYFNTKYPNTFTNEFILGNSFLNLKTNKKVKHTKKELLNRIKDIKNGINKPEETLLINSLEKLTKTNGLYIRKYFAYKLFFKRNEKFKSISTYGENLSQGKIILDAAKSNNVKTIAIQHGMISSYNMGYNYSQYEASLSPMPNLTLSWGEHWKEQIIIHGNYLNESIINVGQPRADIVPIIKKNYTRNKKQVTFFSQPQPDKEERYLAAKSFIETAKNFPNLIFLIKLHPAEKDDIFTSLINNSDVDNVKIEKTKDTYQLLAESGITITCYSTVGVESLYFGTPFITFDSKEKDLAGYIQKGISYLAKNKNDLINLINKYDNNLLTEIHTNNYINKVAYKIDGKVNERVKNIILNSK